MTGQQIWDKIKDRTEFSDARKFDLQSKLLPHWEEEVPAELMTELDSLSENKEDISLELQALAKENEKNVTVGEFKQLQLRVQDLAEAVARLTEYLLKQNAATSSEVSANEGGDALSTPPLTATEEINDPQVSPPPSPKPPVDRDHIAKKENEELEKVMAELNKVRQELQSPPPTLSSD